MKVIISPDISYSTSAARWVVKVNGVRVVCGLAKMQAKRIARRIRNGMSPDRAYIEVCGR